MAVKSKINIEADDKGVAQTVDRVTKRFNQAERSINSFGTGIGGTFSSITGILGNFQVAAGLAITGVISGLGYLVKETIDTAEHIEKMSQRVGVSAEDLSTLTYAAQLSGTEIGVFEKAIQRASRNIDDASRGIGDGRVAFDDLGITVVDTNGKLRDADEVMKDVADRFEDMPDGTKKTALALKIFGRAGADLIPMLNGGSEGLERMQQEARDLGLEISTNTAKEAAEFKDEMLRLESAISGIAVSITSDILPALNSVADWVFDNKNIFGEFINNSIREFELLFYLLDDPSWDKFGQFLLYGSNMKIPQEQINATSEELKNLKEGFGYVVNAAGELEKVKFGINFADPKAKLEYMWGQVEKTLESELKTLNVSPTKLSLSEINKKAQELKSTFGDKEFIDTWANKMIASAQRLQRQWDSTLSTLNNDAELAGLPKAYQEFVRIDQKVESLYQKFGNRSEITDWAEAMKAALLDVNSIEISGYQYEVPDTTGLLNTVEFDTSYYDAQKEAIAEVTALETANWLIREQGTYDMFNNMSSAMSDFYIATGRKNKILFEAEKVFSGGRTLLATIEGAQNAYTWATSWGGPIAGAAAATAASLAGMARVAAIHATKPGNSSYSDVGSSYSPTTNTTNDYSTSNSTQITINVQGGSYHDWDSIVRDEIAPSIQKYISDGGNIKFN